VSEVLFFEADPFPLEQYLPANVSVERRAACETSAPTKDTAFVVLALPPEPQQAARILGSIRTDASPLPLFVLIPEHAAPSDVRVWLKDAEDFVVLPAADIELRERLARMLALASARGASSAFERLHAEHGLRQLVGEHPVFLSTLRQIPKLARSDATVLIQGASGTGKELVARAVHHLSRRRSMSFIAVDCGAFPDHLIENELFGHATGAYTDARQPQKGLAALAAGGTLFLDEIDALSLPAQAKVLRFVQERTFKPLGADRYEKVDIKIVVATNRDLARCVQQERFRSDLYYRLNVLTVTLPSLGSRRSDIPLLVNHFLQQLDPGIRCSPAALRALVEHDWPGNVRELQNVIHRALVACEGPQIQVHHLNLGFDSGPEPATKVAGFKMARASAVSTFERSYLIELMRRHRGNVTQAAREAGKDRRALGRLIKKHHLDRRAGSR